MDEQKINAFYEILEELVELAQEIMQENPTGSGMGQRRKHRSGYRNGSGYGMRGGSGMGQRGNMGQHNGAPSKEELWEALEEFMANRYE